MKGTMTVDVTLEGELPRGARPDLTVDGTVELERLDDVVYVGRPVFGQEESTASLFRLDGEGAGAMRTRVRLGRASVNTIEVLEGLDPGRPGGAVGHVRLGRGRSLTLWTNPPGADTQQLVRSPTVDW